MNKNDAASYLGIGVRSLERHTGAGKVTGRRVKVKTGFALDYEPAELDRFKLVLEAERTALEQASPVSPPASPEPQGGALAVHRGKHHSSLATVAATPASSNSEAFVASQMVQAIAVKLVLTLPECQALTGFSRATLRAAIDDGGLDAKLIGKAWRVKRRDLEAWIEKL